MQALLSCHYYFRKLFHHEGREGHEVLKRPYGWFFFALFVSFVVKIGLRSVCSVTLRANLIRFFWFSRAESQQGKPQPKWAMDGAEGKSDNLWHRNDWQGNKPEKAFLLIPLPIIPLPNLSEKCAIWDIAL